jgi:hypothetical protein
MQSCTTTGAFPFKPLKYPLDALSRLGQRIDGLMFPTQLLVKAGDESASVWRADGADETLIDR